MDISKIKELCDKLPDVKPLPLKYGEPKSQFIIELCEGKEMAKNEELEKRIAENMARLGGSHEFWENRLTHGWDALEAKLKKLHAQGLTDEQIISSIIESWGGKELSKNFVKLLKGEN